MTKSLISIRGPMATTTNAAAERTYEGVASTYDDGYQGPRWDVYDAVTMAIAAARLPAPPARILDAGAGSGKFAIKLLSQGYDVTLLDPSREMLAQARSKVQAAGLEARASFDVGTIERLEADNESFDFVFCEGDPLSYCLDTHEQAARELVRALRPGGGLYASLDNRWFTAIAMFSNGDPTSAFAALDTGRSRDPYGAPVHAFAPEELRSLFARAGLTDVVVTGKVALMNFMPDTVLLPLLQNPAERERFVASEIRAARDPTLAGLGGHLQVVGRKP